MDWWARIKSWRTRPVKPLSVELASRLSAELYDLLPGQMLTITSNTTGRTYAIVELPDLEDLLKRAGMRSRNV